MGEELLNVKKLLRGTRFSNRSDCIAAVFKANNITTIEQVENLPSQMGHICFCDIYQLIEVIKEQFNKPVEPARGEK